MQFRTWKIVSSYRPTSFRPIISFEIMAPILETAVSVGVLNVMLNIFVFIIAYLVGLLATRGIKNLLLLRLNKNGTAPIFCESESRFQRFIDFVRGFRYFQSPTKFLIILLSSVLFLLFEISAESGVDSSDFCKPARRVTMGLCAAPYDGDNSAAKIIASALYTQRLKWKTEDLIKSPIPQGFRTDYDGREAFKERPNNKSLPIVVFKCAIEDVGIIKPNDANITFQNRRDLWHLRMVAVDIKSSGKKFVGIGDVTLNPEYYNAFLIANTTGGNGGPIYSEYLEYPDSQHLHEIRNTIHNSKEEYSISEVQNKNYIFHKRLSCVKNALLPAQFERAVQTYRSTKVESSIHLHPQVQVMINNSVNITVPKPIEAVELMKATISIKSSDRSSCEGETFVYQECGVYDIMYLVPVIVTLLLLSIVVLTTDLLIHVREARLPVPTTAIAWSKYAWEQIGANAMETYSNSKESNGESTDSPLVEYYINPNTHSLTLRRRE